MPFWRRPEKRSVISISDPALAYYFNAGTPSYGGVNVSESTALSLSAVWRAVSLISQTIAQLPMKTYRDVQGVRTQVNSFLDNPGGPDGLTPFEWRELVLTHLLLHGNAFLAHIYGGAGQLVGLQPIHPSCVRIDSAEDVPGYKVFTASLADGSQRRFDATTMTHIPALSTDGLRGLSPISVARNSLSTALAGDRAAAKMFSDGALISGVITPEDDLTEEEAKAIKDGLNVNVAGWENASSIAVINRKLKFTPWSMSSEDAQFLESRQFQIEEVARWYGLQPFQLAQTDKQTSWGTGVAEQNRGLARTVLAPWCARIEQRLSRLLPAPRFVEFEMAGIERGSPAEEIDLLIKQVQAGLLTVDEARAIRNLPPLPAGALPAAEPVPVEVPL